MTKASTRVAPSSSTVDIHCVACLQTSLSKLPLSRPIALACHKPTKLANHPAALTMAPSRALFVAAHLRSSPRLLPAAPRTIRTCAQAHRLRLRPALFSGPTRAFPALSSRRGYATEAPEPPDYLNEAELHIFNKIKTELQPVKLEVRSRPRRSAY